MIVAFGEPYFRKGVQERDVFVNATRIGYTAYVEDSGCWVFAPEAAFEKMYQPLFGKSWDLRSDMGSDIATIAKGGTL